MLTTSALTALMTAYGGIDIAFPATAAVEHSPAGAIQTLTTQSVSVDLPSTALPVATSALRAQPLFHVAPVVLDKPSQIDITEPASSATSAPHTQTVSAELSQLSTRRLTWSVIESVLRDGIVPADSAPDAPGATPFTTGTAVATYTPAQIRAAYGLPALPPVGTTLNSVQAAQLGAGQTIYLIDAQDDPNAATELATFNQQFGLPTCSTTSITSSSTFPLASAGTSSCTFSVVYTTTSGAMTSSAPTYDSGWATEIALDVQWAHATAPLARIILIEAPDSSVSSLQAAVSLANSMGPGVVSMSFGSTEGSWTASVDSTFTIPAMSYVAAAGDSGAGVNWPAVSSHVLAVGGSSLTYTGSSPRSEIVWSNTGGGVSQYTPAPSYQTSAVPDMGTSANRSVSDVTFNADPSTGQYVAVLALGTTTPNWLSAGGTSLATPQWAGIIAVANALRSQAAQTPLGDPHTKIYGLATASSTYASAFFDITRGSDGACASCYAETGYDLPTGIGTPNVTNLWNALDAVAPPTAPVVPPASVSGTAGISLSFNVSVTAAHPVTYALSNAPSGMSINTSGVVSWTNPSTGTFAVTVSASDTVTGMVGQGVYSVTIHAPQPPIVARASLTGSAGSPLIYTVSVTDANPVTYTLGGAPTGMAISAAGILSWPSPVTGAHTVTVTAHDTKTGLTGQGALNISIAAPTPPRVSAASISAIAGKALSFAVSVAAADPLTFSISSAPSGMAISKTGVITWSNPVAGTYHVTAIAKDTVTGLSGSALLTITVSPAGPVISANALTGVAHKSLTGTIAFSDATSTTININVSGIPSGMSVKLSGASLVVSWASPVTGSYKLGVTAKDGNGRTASSTVSVTITAK